MVTGRNVTVMDMMKARDERAARQMILTSFYGMPVISFTMNIAGPVKTSMLIERTFGWGKEKLLEALHSSGISIREIRTDHSYTGCSSLLACEADADALKRICTEIEDGWPVGRLFDIDVTETDGMQLRRQSERACIVCGRPGRECASRRLHSAGEVMEASEKLMREHFLSLDSGAVADMLVEALNDEVLTTPKPGLVDMNNNGSHDDMDVQLFLRSSNSLREYFRSCFIAGAESITGGKELFCRLRELGIEAEGRMYEATGGINTHKGAIYTLGIVSSAAGRLWSPDGRKGSPEEICLECGRIAGQSARDHLMKISGSGAETSGEKLYLQLGLPGARGEMAEGLPSVKYVSLPAYQRYIREGHSTNDSAAYSLLHLIALGKDTNMYARGGKAQAEAAVKEVREMLEKKDPPDMCEIEGLDRDFIERRLSPGGCADLLAATLFLDRYCIHRE